ncbi:MAG TPA: 2-hydroxyacid dehydrogenase [Devosiaceae bacterium]|jgi:lactate dehydrogenase-like 2-hydroxyacid dehydrogenase|nr:2-hydroxyacid dehydrogenase [Devosiaceae bacterium]
MPKPLFLSIDRLPDPVRAQLPDLVEFVEVDPSSLDAALEARGGEVRLISSRGKHRIDGALLDRLPSLGLIAGYGVGYDKIDAQAAVQRDVMVTHTPDVLNADVADLAVALLLATLRQLPQADRFVREGRWREGSYPLTATLRDRTIGLVGMGRIGRAIARRLAAFDLEIAYHTRNPVEGLSYTYVDSLVALARQVDALVVIVPGGASTEGLIGGEVLKALGEQGVLVNVSRGTVVDQDALVAALTDGTILAAGLDVFRDEPAVPEGLLALNNVVLLPHIGSGTIHTRAAMDRLYLDNITAWLAHRPVLTPVPECRVKEPL